MATVAVPHAEKLEGRVVVIGDNLAAHFTPAVLKLCRDNNISFVCLPPNATHICQPLDVAFFRPFKQAWRAVLTAWKMKHPKQSTVPKNELPQLLKESLDRMDRSGKDGEVGAIAHNLISGFRATGLSPLDSRKILDKLPGDHQDTNAVPLVSEALLTYLKKMRHDKPTPRRQGRKKLAVVPGKSVLTAESSPSSSDVAMPMDTSDDDSTTQEAEDNAEPTPGPSRIEKPTPEPSTTPEPAGSSDKKHFNWCLFVGELFVWQEKV